jgi:predicted HTH transcriptional regulator
MSQIRIFISSVQKEFAKERAILRDYLQSDPLLLRFFHVFLFESMPAADRRADDVYLLEVEQSDIYVGLFGQEYGYEDKKGLSPTHREFNLATRLGKHRLIFVKGADDKDKSPKMQALIRKAGNQVIRRRFATISELIAALYASLVKYLEEKDLIRTGPFDASFCRNADIGDLDEEKIKSFLSLARRARGFPLAEDATPMHVLTHLNLLDKQRPSNASILLFGKQPQRFLISSEVKCAHFHGTEVTKPIPSYQVYKGTVFELVDRAVDFVMSKIDLAVGTRALSTQAPVAYEIPLEVVREAIVNAVAHRDYTSNGSVQVMLFSDRLEVWNPGTLSPPLTIERLRQPHASLPCNPLLAEPLYLTKYIERMGTGTGDMIKRCRKAGLREPEFSIPGGFVATVYRKPGVAFESVSKASGQVSPEPTEDQVGTKSGPSRDQVEILRYCMEDRSIADLMAIAGRTNRTKYRDQVLNPLIQMGLIEMAIPGKPTSSRQKYRLTQKGRDLVVKLAKEVGADGK